MELAVLLSHLRRGLKPMKVDHKKALALWMGLPGLHRQTLELHDTQIFAQANLSLLRNGGGAIAPNRPSPDADSPRSEIKETCTSADTGSA